MPLGGCELKPPKGFRVILSVADTIQKKIGSHTEGVLILKP